MCLAFGVTRPNKDENGRGGLSGFTREIETDKNLETDKKANEN
jgi:hypothetical protein